MRGKARGREGGITTTCDFGKAEETKRKQKEV
jgi:hypothetical protein